MRFFPSETTATAPLGSGYSCNSRPRFRRGPSPVPLPSASWQDEHRSTNTPRPATSTGSGVPSGPASTSGEEPDPHPAPTAADKAKNTTQATTAFLAATSGNILGYRLRSHTKAAADSIRLLVCGRGCAGLRRADSVGRAGLERRFDHPQLASHHLGNVESKLHRILTAPARPTTGRPIGVSDAASAIRRPRRERRMPAMSGSSPRTRQRSTPVARSHPIRPCCTASCGREPETPGGDTTALLGLRPNGPAPVCMPCLHRKHGG